MRKNFVFVFLIFVFFLSQKQELPAPTTDFKGYAFEEVADIFDKRVPNFNLKQALREKKLYSEKLMSGGVAVGDYNNDGWVDMYVTLVEGGGILYKNDHGNRFLDVTKSVGLASEIKGMASGVSWIDIDNDNDNDLYVATVNNNKNYLFLNEDGKFTEVGNERGVAVTTGKIHKNTSVTVGDFNNDGFADLHLNEWYRPDKTMEPVADPEAPHARLLKNLGKEKPGYFIDITESAGVDISDSYSFVSAFSDLDNDGNTDLVVVGDFMTSVLFWNNGDETFTRSPRRDGFGTDENGMGLTIGDLDFDNQKEIFITSIYNPQEFCTLKNRDLNKCPKPITGVTGNRLLTQDGDRHLIDITDKYSVRDGGWGWGAVFFDYDNDGDLDLTMNNDMRMSKYPIFEPLNRQPMPFWENTGSVFSEKAAEFGITSEEGRGIATLDYDNDGDLDLFIVQNGDYPKLYENKIGQNNPYLKVAVKGAGGSAVAYGATVTIFEKTDDDGKTLELNALNTYLSQSQQILHFGIDAEVNIIPKVVVKWNTGEVREYNNVPINSTLHAQILSEE